MNRMSPVLLFVDTEPFTDLQDTLQLKDRTTHVIQVGSAAECLKLAMEKKIGVAVVSDQLPDISGIQLVNLLKKMKPDLEIIFTTSCHEPQKEIDARLAGILYYAVKPVDWSLLGQVIEKALTRQSEKNRFNQSVNDARYANNGF